MTLLAAEVDLFTLNDGLFWLLRFVATLGGAFVGWFVTGPLARILYRVARGKPIPGWAVPWCKLLGAALVGLLVYLLIPLGGGPGGLGHGPGPGGLPGTGKGDGNNPGPIPVEVVKKSDTKPTPLTPPKTATREVVEIELLGGRRFPGEGRYYLLKRAGAPQKLDEIESYFRAHKDALEVHLVMTDESVGLRHAAVTRLRELANTYRIPLVEPPEEKK